MNAPQSFNSDTWTVAGRTFGSRLIVGTGKFGSLEVMRDNGLALSRRRPA